MRKLKVLLSVLAFITLSFAFVGFITPTSARAEEEITASPYASLWVNDLGGFEHTGATRDAKTNGVSALTTSGRVGYDTYFENVEVSAIVNFTTRTAKDNNSFYLRLNGDVEAGSYTNRGYQVRWYGSGKYQILKNNTRIFGGANAVSGLLSTTTGKDYKVVFSTINLSDGSVKLTFTTGNKTITFIDTVGIDGEETESNQAPIFGAGKYMVAFGGDTSGSIQGNADFNVNAISLYDLATPYTNANFPGTTINEDKSVLLTGSGIAGGVGFAFQQTKFGFYKFNYTPINTAGTLQMAIYASGTLNRISNMSNKGYVKTLSSLSPSTSYEIVYGVDVLTDGESTVNRIITKVNDNVSIEVDTENKVSLSNYGGEPSSINRLFVIQGNNSTSFSGTISPSDSTVSYETKTLLTSDLGTPANHSGATFDRNGGIAKMCGGRNAGYNGNFKNVKIEFYTDFTVAGELVMQLRANGSEFYMPDGEGSAWTNRGYTVHIMSNGQTNLTKNKVRICDGWSLSEEKLTTTKKHLIEFGTVDLTESAVRVWASIDGKMVVNYIDYDNPILEGGWFTLVNGKNCQGKLLPTIEYPVLTTDVLSDTNVLVGEDVVLSCTGENVSYFIDEDKSTANATISENNLTPTSSGVVVAYASVNGIYSNDITFTAQTMPTLTDVPTELKLSETATIGVSCADGTEILSKAFYLVNGTGEGVIDAQTGLITPVRAGTISVYAIVNGIRTEEQTINLKLATIVTISAPSQIEFGDTGVINVSLSDSSSIESKEFIVENDSGEATISNSGEITTIKAGLVRVYAIVNGVVSNTIEFTIIPKITLIAPSVIIKGQNVALDFNVLGADKQDVSCSYQIVSGSNVAEVNVATGALNVLTDGQFSAKLVVSGEDFTAESQVMQIKVIKTVITASQNVIEHGSNLVVSAGLSDASVPDTIVYEVQNLTGEGDIDAQTGEITTIKAGKVKVYAIVNGIETEKLEITIIPKVSLTLSASKIIKGETLTSTIEVLGATEYSVSYQIVSGESVAQVSQMGVFTIKDAGEFSVKVIVSGVDFTAESQAVSVIVIKAVLTNIPDAPIIVGGEKFSVGATLSDGSQIETLSFQRENLSGKADIDALTGEITAIGAGTVKIFAVVNGQRTNEATITIIPKLSINKVGAFAFTGVYDLSNYWSVNCELPEEDITVVFELVSSNDYATLNGSILTAGTTPGVIRLKCTIYGETFSAVSEVEDFSIEQPKVIVQNDLIDNINVGQSVTIVASISHGGITINSSRIVILSGEDLVTVSGMTITAKAGGLVKFKVIVNEMFEDTDEGLEISIEPLVATIIANEEIYAGKTEQASIMFNSTYYTASNVVWSVVSGADFLSISQTGEITAISEGTAVIKAVVDEIYTATLTIEVKGKVNVAGISPNAEVKVGSTLTLSYTTDLEIEGEPSVEFIIVKGHKYISLDENGTLIALETGEVSVKVVVNGVESQTLTFKIVENYLDSRPDDPTEGSDPGLEEPSSNAGLIIGLSAAGAVVAISGATGTTIFVRKRKRK